jgi:hypothetical protein
MNLDEPQKLACPLPSCLVGLSPWVNELLPPIELTARDVARLPRRARCMVAGLALVGRIPRKYRCHGRHIDWMQEFDAQSENIQLSADLGPQHNVATLKPI